LRNVLLRISVGKSAQLGIHRRNLVPGQPRASTGHHVLLSVRNSRKARRAFIPAGQIILFDRHYWSQGGAHNHNAQSVIQLGAGDVRRLLRLLAANREDRKHRNT
jgi:hypothetical protein